MTKSDWIVVLCQCVTTFSVIGYSLVSGSTTMSSLTAIPATSAVRLVGGTSTEGRLEVYYNGQWGTICNNYFDDLDASVACRMMGMSGVSRSLTNSYGEGTGPIWLDNVNCNGSETSLAECQHQGWGVHSCTHYQDVSIVCNFGLHCYAAFNACDASMRTDVLGWFDDVVYGRVTPNSLSLSCSNWQTCTEVTNDTSCSLHEAVELINNYERYFGYSWQIWANYLHKPVETFDYICNTVLSDYATYYDCFRNYSDDIISRCNAIQSTKSLRPFYLGTDFCESYIDKARCLFSGLGTTCSRQVAEEYAHYYHEYSIRYSNTMCYNDVNQVVNYSKPVTIPGCDDDAFFFCASQLHNSYSAFYDLTHSDYNLPDQFCSNWESFLTCMPSTGCTFNAIQLFTELTHALSTYYHLSYTYVHLNEHPDYSRRDINATFEAFIYLCGEGRESVNQRCKIHTHECDVTMDMKMSNPYFVAFISCSLEYEDALCTYRTAETECGKTAAIASFKLRLKFNELWLFYERWYPSISWYWSEYNHLANWKWRREMYHESRMCNFSYAELYNGQLPGVQCDDARHVTCAYRTSLNQIIYNNGIAYLFLGGFFDNDKLSYYCGFWERFASCLSCNSTMGLFNKIDFFKAHSDYGNFWQYTDEDQKLVQSGRVTEAITPRQWQMVCYSDRGALLSHQECFRNYSSTYGGYGFYNMMYYCIRHASAGETSDACRYHESWLKCLHTEIVSYCSVAAADFALEYYMTELSDYMRENKGCIIDLHDKTTTDSELSEDWTSASHSEQNDRTSVESSESSTDDHTQQH